MYSEKTLFFFEHEGFAAIYLTVKMDVNPAELRFTEDSIVSHFQEHHHQIHVREAVQLIRQGKLTASFQDPLKVIKYKEYLWALDNRKLWVFRMAQCSLIQVEVVGKRSDPGNAVRMVLSDPATYNKLSSPLFLPKIRKSRGHKVHAEEKSSLTQCLEAAQVQKPNRLAAGCCTLMDVNPVDLRFTSESIVSHFQEPYQHVHVREAVNMICQGKVTASDFQNFIRVVKHKEHWWALDNRRLWVFQMAGCTLIKVEVVGKKSDLGKAATKFLNDPEIYNKLSSSVFSPEIRDRRMTSEQTDSCFRRMHFELMKEGSTTSFNFQQQSKILRDVNPADLRFTQGSISCHFQKPHHSLTVHRAVEMIQTGSMNSESFPRLRVMFHQGCWWSLDNRRLWVFRMAKCSSIVVTCDPKTTMHPRMKGVTDYPRRCRWLSKANFLPKITGTEKLLPPPVPLPIIQGHHELSREGVLSTGSFRADILTADGDSKALLLKGNSGVPEFISVSADANENASESISAAAGPTDVEVPQVYYVNYADGNRDEIDKETPFLPRATAVTERLSCNYSMIVAGANGWQGLVSPFRPGHMREDQQAPDSNPSTFPLFSGLQNGQISTSGFGNPPRTVDEGARKSYLKPLLRCLKYLILFCTISEWSSI